MIGQRILYNQFNQLLLGDRLPHFVMLTGPKGSGKKTLVSELEYPDAELIKLSDSKVDSVRHMIEMSYKVRNKIFLIPDADTMSITAQNALLKIVEECPNDNYYIMTVEDVNNVLPTIKSRATVFQMQTYKPNEILLYYKRLQQNDKANTIVTDLCENPGDVNILIKVGILQFYDYVQLVVDNIDEVSTANCFKIADKVALKDTEEGYDLRLFWKAFIRICGQRMVEYSDTVLNANWILITSKHLERLSIRGINKRMLLDDWILSIRKCSEACYGR